MPASSASIRPSSGSLHRPNLDVVIIGRTPQMDALRAQIDRIAPTEVKVLITGESGVGKEVVARALHGRSRRCLNAFESVNCAGVPEALLESELFGYAKGSVAGAYADQPGKLEAAHMGTVFLDEVGEVSVRMQGLLLRFLETGEIPKAGVPGSGRFVDTRVIAATSRDLDAMVAERTFRQDLFYRLNVVRIEVPPLRERRDDIPLLLDHYVAKYAAVNHSDVTGFTTAAVDRLIAYRWPGNVRELENLVERLVVMVPHDIIDAGDLPREMREGHAEGHASVATSPEALYARMSQGHESFWRLVYPRYMNRELTRDEVREIVRLALTEARGNYRIVTRLFNLELRDYKRFMNFLRQHGCHVPFKDYR